MPRRCRCTACARISKPAAYSSPIPPHRSRSRPSEAQNHGIPRPTRRRQVCSSSSRTWRSSCARCSATARSRMVFSLAVSCESLSVTSASYSSNRSRSSRSSSRLASFSWRSEESSAESTKICEAAACEAASWS